MFLTQRGEQPGGVGFADASFQIEDGEDMSVVVGLRIHTADYTIVHE